MDVNILTLHIPTCTSPLSCQPFPTLRAPSPRLNFRTLGCWVASSAARSGGRLKVRCSAFILNCGQRCGGADV